MKKLSWTVAATLYGYYVLGTIVMYLEVTGHETLAMIIGLGTGLVIAYQSFVEEK